MAELEDRRRGSPSGEEELRFIRNFHDIFLSLGLGMFAVGLAIVTGLIVGSMTGDVDESNWRQLLWTSAAAGAIDAVILWMLGEIFARTRRLFLPSIVILVAFLFFVISASIAGYMALFADQNFNEFEDAMEKLKAMPMTIAAIATLATFVFYLRTKLPFSMGVLGVGIATTAVGALVFMDHEQVIRHATWLTLVSGLFLFVLGVWFDARDPERRTRISDNGFWLHFFAAPMIFSSTLSLTTGGASLFSDAFEAGRSVDGAYEQAFGAGAAATTLIVVIIFAVISLLINRRALLVSGLLSAAIAIGVLVKETGLDGAWTAALTLLLLGGAMVLLGGGWHTVRRALVAPFPKTGVLARIVPPEPPAGEKRGDPGE